MQITVNASLLARLRSTPALGAIFTNAAWLVVDRLMRGVFTVIVGAFMARYLGLAQYGEFAYVVAYVAFFQVISNLGMDNVIVRDLATDASNAHEILGTAFLMRLVAGASCWLLAVAGMAVWQGANSEEFRLSAIIGACMIFQSADVIDLWFQSKSKSVLTVIPRVIASAIANLTRIGLILLHASLTAFAVVLLLEYLMLAVGLLISYRRLPIDDLIKVNFGRAVRTIKETFPYMFSSLAVTVYTRFDQLMIKQFIGNEAAGLYAAALPFTQIWHIIPTTLCTSLAPLVARQRHESMAKYKNTLLMIFRSFGVLSVVLAIGTAAAAPTLVSLFYGSKFIGADTIVAIQVFSNVFIFQGVAQTLWLINEKNSKLYFTRTFLGACTAIITNLILLPTIGVIGAPISTVVSSAVADLFSNLLFAREIFWMQLGFRPKEDKFEGPSAVAGKLS